MKSYVLGLAALAAIGFAGAAYAGDVTPPKAMTDSEMDKVTAGAALYPGFGLFTKSCNQGISCIGLYDPTIPGRGKETACGGMPGVTTSCR